MWRLILIGLHASILTGLTLLAVAVGMTASLQAEGKNEASRSVIGEPLTKLLHRFCADCHGADTQEAGIRLDRLDFTVQDARTAGLLDRVLEVLSSEKMPPELAEMPTAQQRASLISGLEGQMKKLAHEARRSGRWTRNRRLTVEEYNFTMQALFGVDAQFADLLPADAVSESGYRNDSERLGLSSLQIEAYLDSARRAVQRYVQFGRLDSEPVRYHIELEDLYYSTADRYKTRQRAPEPVGPAAFLARRAANADGEPAYVDPLGPWLPGAFTDDEAKRAAIPKLNQQYVALPRRLPVGELIVRVRAAGTADRDGRFPRMRVEAGITLGDGCSMNKRILGEVDVTAAPDRPETYEFRMRLEDVPTKGPLKDEEAFDRLSVFDMDQIFISNVSPDQKAIFDLGLGGYSDPETGSKQIAGKLKQMADDGANFLHLDCVEIEMYPGVGGGNEPYRWQVPAEEASQELSVAREIVKRFMQAAYRRPIAGSELATRLELFETFRDRQFSFEESLRETLVAVLVSPSFLFLEQNPPETAADSDQLTSYQLASRLSYLIWLSPPDKRLMKRAADGSLREPQVLHREAERLLSDPRSRRFLDSFCRQWLRLDQYANRAIDRQRYPAYDDDLASASIRETLAYFREVFHSDANALDLIDSNYAILNDRLAELYDVDNVTTGQLQKVQLPEGSVRGGLLTQASLLTMNSDGVDSHPIRRGVWLLERILNKPPPPPPPNVPDIDEDDPDFRGLSLKERIELHRQPGACLNCHEKIDPWGLPFENFDATGGWRTQVEVEEGEKRHRKPVDATALLPDGTHIDGIAELKTYLRKERSEQFANSLVHHMLTYTLGRRPDYLDRPQVNEIQDRFAASDYRLKELVLAIVDSELFRQKSSLSP